jgi:hypothetical protein
MGSLIAAVLARAQGFLLEPPPTVEAPAAAVPVLVPAVARNAVQVAVTGLSRGSGATTVAAGLAHALVVPGERSGHLVSLRPGATRRGPPGVVVWELPPALRNSAEIADYGSTLARLAAGSDAAAVVWDVGADDMALATHLLEGCDALVCVTDGSAEPALCTLVCDMLAERYGRVLLVPNRVRDEEAWSGRCAVAVPESRLAAALIVRGRAPGGALAAALARLAAAVEDKRP